VVGKRLGHEREGSHDTDKVPDNVRGVKKKAAQNPVPDRPWQEQGFALKRLRRAKGLDQASIAKNLGVRRATISDWERGVQIPRGAYIQALAAILCVEPAAFNPVPAPAAGSGPGDGIPIIGAVAAGDPTKHDLRFTREDGGMVRVTPGTFGLRVYGDSMAPVALDGQVVVCDEQGPLPGDLVVACLKAGGAMFRRYTIATRAGTLVFDAVNLAQGGPVELDPEDIESCHRVVGVRFITD